MIEKKSEQKLKATSINGKKYDGDLSLIAKNLLKCVLRGMSLKTCQTLYRNFFKINILN